MPDNKNESVKAAQSLLKRNKNFFIVLPYLDTLDRLRSRVRLLVQD